MCITAIMAGTALGTGLLQANAQKKAGAAQAQAMFNQGVSDFGTAVYNQEMANDEARAIKKQSLDQANLIKRKAAEMRGAMIAAQGGTGVVIGEGSAQATLDMVDALSTADVMVAMYEGIDRAVMARAQGANIGRQGESALRSAIEGANSTIDAANTSANATLASSIIQAGSIYFGPSLSKGGTSYAAGATRNAVARATTTDQLQRSLYFSNRGSGD